MKILGIESSCDETAAALVDYTGGRFSVLSNVVASQIEIHKKTKGVVPEVAARCHVEAIIPVIKEAMQNETKPDAIAITKGPGLVTSLRIGVDTARTLSFFWGVPMIGVNHLEGHIYASVLQNTAIEFPALCLVVSGGHTELVLMKKHLDYKIIGETRDDAAGEAFDKVAKILDLGYPGGPEISKLAKEGNPKAIDFPRPMIDSKDFDFSFSGLKTAVLYYVKNLKPKTYNLKPDICASFEQAVVDVLVAKTICAAKKYKVKTVILGGGVSANQRLRDELSKAVKNLLPTSHSLLPSLKYTTDNAAMIATVGVFHAINKNFISWEKIDVDPNLSL